MRFNEMASAAEQMALWRLISDNVWAAIEQQAREEEKRKAAERAKPKAKGAKKGVAKAVALPLPRVAPPAKPANPPQAAPAGQQLAPVGLSTNAAPTTAAAPADRSSAPMVGSPNPLNRPVRAVNTAKNRLQKSDDDTDDRHSENGFSPSAAVRTAARR